MNNNLKVIIGAVVVVLLAVAMLYSNIKSPALQEIMKQQDEMIKIQSRMEAKMTGSSADNAKVYVLEKKVEELENKLKALETFLMQGGQQRAQQQQQQQQPPAEDLSKVYDLPIGSSPIRGKQDAPITIVEFSDFQCPYCSRFHPVSMEVLKAFPNDVKYVLKHFPLSFHKDAKPASKAAFAANEQGKYWEMVDALYENNKQLNEEKFKEIAKGLGMDVDKFMKDLKEKDAQWEEMIQKDMSLGSQSQVRGTPTFFLNGKKTMSRDLNGFKSEIEQILQGIKK